MKLVLNEEELKIFIIEGIKNIGVSVREKNIKFEYKDDLSCELLDVVPYAPPSEFQQQTTSPLYGYCQIMNQSLSTNRVYNN